MSNVPEEEDRATDETVADALHEAIAADDREQLESIVESISSQEALHQVSLMGEEQRDRLMSILTPETAAELIEEAPVELAAALVSGQETAVAAAIMEELYSDAQADIVLEMAEDDAEALLYEMGSESADKVRKLTQYAPDTAGGLMDLAPFSFRSDETVGAVL